MCSCGRSGSVCVHRKTGSSGTATHCEAQHCISQHWDVSALTSNLWIRLFPTAEEDLQWWTSAHHVLRVAPVTLTEPDTQLFTDALNICWGQHWNALTVSGVWTTTEKTLHINMLDLEAIHRARLHWLQKLVGLTVLVASVEHGQYSCRRTKRLLMCQDNQIVLRAGHIPGRLNEWSLHPSVFQALTGNGNPFTGFVYKKVESQLPLFVSPVPDPSAMGVDALSMGWKALWAHAYPPPALWPRVLEKGQWLQNQFCTQQEIIRDSIIYIPPSIHLDYAPCQAMEPG